jgi:hypothetical protein
MLKWTRRIAIGLVFSIPMAIVSFGLMQIPAQAQSADSTDPDCATCHPAFQDTWAHSAHGLAASDPIFQEEWTKQGQPKQCLSCHTTGYDPDTNTWEADGVACIACHEESFGDHPMNPIGIDRSADFCGKCHTETLFEWQVSGHRQDGIECVDCHDAHGAELKAFDTSMLCGNCHQGRALNYFHTAHNEEGMSCADCHLGELGGLGEGGQATRNHSFNVTLTTCNECHMYEMHDPVEVHPEPNQQPIVNTMAAAEDLVVIPEPEPVSPVGFATVAGLIGMASGMILAPWLERFYRRINHPETDLEERADE